MKRSLILAAVTLIGMAGAWVLAQSPAPDGPMGGDMKGMADRKDEMSPQMMMCCPMMMGMVVSPTDPAAILAFKDQLKLTEAQTAQLEAINKEAQDKAVAVLTADQKTMLDAVPDSPQAMNEMRRQRMGCWMMCCPMMKTDSGDSTQPEKDQPATPQNQEAHP